MAVLTMDTQNGGVFWQAAGSGVAAVRQKRPWALQDAQDDFRKSNGHGT